MGKWAEVQCSCVNRKPLKDGSSVSQPHRRKRRLTHREKEDVEEWQRQREFMFECGHRNGVVVELWPGDIITLGYLAERILTGASHPFPVFGKVGNSSLYVDELLLIPPDEALLWQTEIDAILGALDGRGDVTYPEITKLVIEFHRLEVSSILQIRSSLDEISAGIPFARTAPFRETLNVQGSPDVEATVRKIVAALSAASSLCHASFETGNPIRLLW
jgi:hypothetical protein